MQELNLQIRIDESMAKKIDRLASKSRSAFVREAIEEKIQRETALKKEEQWIKALKKHPDDSSKEWLAAEVWEDA